VHRTQWAISKSRKSTALVLTQALHEICLPLSTGGALVIFVRVFRAAFRVGLRLQIVNFDFSSSVLRGLRLAIFIGHNLGSLPAHAENIRLDIINQDENSAHQNYAGKVIETREHTRQFKDKNCLGLSGKRINHSVHSSFCALHNAVPNIFGGLRGALRNVGRRVDGSRLNSPNGNRNSENHRKQRFHSN
jgi:hypothetical protein